MRKYIRGVMVECGEDYENEPMRVRFEPIAITDKVESIGIDKTLEEIKQQQDFELRNTYQPL